MGIKKVVAWVCLLYLMCLVLCGCGGPRGGAWYQPGKTLEQAELDRNACHGLLTFRGIFDPSFDRCMKNKGYKRYHTSWLRDNNIPNQGSLWETMDVAGKTELQKGD